MYDPNDDSTMRGSQRPHTKVEIGQDDPWPDHEMEEIELVQLWMANGFIPSEGQINRLAYRWSFDLQGTALFVLKHETYILESRKAPRFPKMHRHLCLNLKSSWEIPENQTKLKLPIDNSLRSLIVHESNALHRAQSFLSFLSKQRNLRVLTLNLIDSEELLELPKCLKVMKNLCLSWKNDINENSEEEVLEGLQPHENLEKMLISSYQGPRFPNWMSTAAFKHLKEIHLENCIKCEHLPALGKLPSLADLTLDGIDSVKHLGVEWYGNGEIISRT
ncbi:hypothetical protein BUALT_Bualt18G0049700 [Buddleja alternifolia]|uniref:R13L1/DRL21-like LRR repeat region domain-containing protein n=1 Tax=Buddleja alternifolia TaxID=168488 RepID=A0AAV6WCY5_9LAMI|nr:hypothetical protein BUALT_Bualt18G0049700 [Buddleja alternifolia]